jgi:serine/threonine protein kinase
MLTRLIASPAHLIRTAQSLGCVLFALAYLRSPFETTQTTEQGGSIAMAVLNAQYKHPASNYSRGLKTLIDTMLKVNPQDRPDIHQVILPHTLTPLHLLTHIIKILDVTARLLQSA